ncbi:hypothetical protein [Paenibacillus spongiae]|uniref:Uncharacterized protein n=1 Tax=Paenibacillus spongiae TaxID=2909671 RepID=A0ABY5S6V0_9BACL|nr:hypothetical protein [Paenibacillus spongiae]UVI29651.1 hypothetical protein L1F29_30270 [Paenibacillus spongiae]
MVVAIDTIIIKSGHVGEVSERFKNPKDVRQAAGFVRMELLAVTSSVPLHVHGIRT